MRTLARVSAIILGASLAIACGASGESRGFGEGDPAGGGGTGGPGGEFGSGNVDPQSKGDTCEKMDLLFVIDDSGSMGEEQTNLAANFPKFVSVLEQFKTSKGAALDYRIAVTTTGKTVSYTLALPPPFPPMQQNEKGDDGAFRQKCGMSKRWIDRTDANPAQTFSCVAKVGTSGSSLEMPLEAIRLSLGDRMNDGTNKGFLRDDALLAIVVLTDEDDCSRKDNNFSISTDACEGAPLPATDEYVKFLDGVKKEHGRWAAAVVAGTGPGKCTSSFGDAIEGKRLRTFVNGVGKNGRFSSICDGDLSKAMADALTTFDAACKSFPPVK